MSFSSTTSIVPSALLSSFPAAILGNQPISLISTESGLSTIKSMSTGTVSVNPGTVAAAGSFATTATITGASIGDILLTQIENSQASSVALDAFYVSAENTATIVFVNRDAATARARGATTIRYLWIAVK